MLLDHVPLTARRILDLGTGDGRLLALLRGDRPEMCGVGLDFSELMLDAARTRFADDQRIELVEHDLAEPLPALGRFDAVVSSMAIHHLEHERKRSLYGEVFELLAPGATFANFEHVASPTDRLHLAFFEAIGEPLEHEDPSDRLLDVETQLRWLREIGFDDVDCYWKWLEIALLVGVKPGATLPAPRADSLARRVYQHSHLTGEFRLRSGATSDEYFDKYLFESDPAVLREIARALVDLLPERIDAVAGLELGGVPLATVVSQICGLPALFVRKQPKTYGTGRLAEGGEVSGRRLAVIEDVVTSGGQVVASCRALRERGAEIAAVVCVLDRETGGAATIAADGLELRPAFTMSQLRAAAGV